MFEADLPYDHKTMHLKLEDKNFAGLMEGHQNEFKPEASQEELVEKSLDNPYGSPKLEELCRGKRDIVIISSDHTRPVPSRVTMPILLRRIHTAAPEARVRILVATGMHRPSTHEELVNKYGEKIVAEEEIVMHVATDDSMMEKVGTLPSGGECIINKVAADADLLLAEGFIEPHFFAGFSGGRKAVLPGVVGRATTMFNHCAGNIDDRHSRTGILEGNRIHSDMCEGAAKAGLEFILNVVLNDKKEVIGAFSGDLDEAHSAGVGFIQSLCRCKAAPADIVVTTNGGYPLDQNIYQAVKGMSTAEMTCRPGGVIVMASECSDGHGAQAFYDTFAREPSNGRIMEDIRSRSASQTVPDQWQSQIFLRILLNHTVIFVSDAPKEVVENLHMVYSPSMEDAMRRAFAIAGEAASVTVIPDGVSTLIE